MRPRLGVLPSGRTISRIVLAAAAAGALAGLLRAWTSPTAAGAQAEWGIGLAERRAQLVAAAQAWNQEALTAGVARDELLAIGDNIKPLQLSQDAHTGCADGVIGTEARDHGVAPDAGADPAMVGKLAEVAEGGEVMLALANGVMICQNVTICWWDGGNILKSWLHTLRFAGITNYLIAVLDDETETYLREVEHETRFFRPNLQVPEKQKGSHPANQISTLKYGMVAQILSLGYNVLVADMDLVFLKDPFQHLHRDSDLESQTDGFTPQWSYGQFGGIADKTMGWGGGGLYLQVFTLNVGCIFLRANERTVELMRRVRARLLASPGWDQQIFNEEVWFPSHGDYHGSQVSVRVMDIFKFMNSKIFFRSSRRRYIPGQPQPAAEFPVMIHMNYHPDKHKRMLCLMARYMDGKWGACDDFPGGSEPGT
eukprot:jgi/Tetstr1/465768/TSEL_010393.t1